MKIKFTLIILIISLLSCSKKEDSDNQFKYFEFSFDNSFESCFSIKFSPNDSIYLQEHWNSHTIWNSNYIPKEKINYIAVISKTDRKQLCHLIAQTEFKKYNSIDDDNFKDGITYVFYIDKDSIQKLISMHSYNDIPKELDSLGKWIYNWKKKAKLIQTNKNLTFKSSKYILPPPPPPPIETK